MPSEATISRVEFSQLPKRRGAVNITIIVEFTANGELEQRLTLAAVVNLSDQPKAEIVPRNTSLNLSIRLGTTNVSTLGTTLQSGEVGSIVLCRVVKTKKVLRAKIISNVSAEVLGE
jgi:flagella basal body P-ring formation protein FlgA